MSRSVAREAERMDNRMLELYKIDAAIKLGRMEGELMEMRKRMYYEGHLKEMPAKYERTPEFRLMRWYGKQFKKLYYGY